MKHDSGYGSFSAGHVTTPCDWSLYINTKRVSLSTTEHIHNCIHLENASQHHIELQPSTKKTLVFSYIYFIYRSIICRIQINSDRTNRVPTVVEPREQRSTYRQRHQRTV